MLEFATDAEFRAAAGDALRVLLDQIDAIEHDDVDARLSEGSLIVSFESGGTYMLSLQTPTQELWLSANLTAWHCTILGLPDTPQPSRSRFAVNTYQDSHCQPSKQLPNLDVGCCRPAY